MQEWRDESEIYNCQPTQLSNNKFINEFWGVRLTWLDCNIQRTSGSGFCHTHTRELGKLVSLPVFIDPIIPNINMHTLLTVCYTFLMVLLERIAQTSTHFTFGDHFLHCRDLYVCWGSVNYWQNLCDDYRGRVSTFISEVVQYAINPETDSVIHC